MSIRFIKWLIVVLLAAAVVLALRETLRDPVDDPGLGRLEPGAALVRSG
jgi:hypothetical protein